MSLTRIPRPDYEKPFHWWGYAWQPPTPATLSALVRGRMLTVDNADVLIDALTMGKSLAVVSDSAGAGKSTLLWALADSARGNVRRIYIRGQYEPFAFVRLREPNSSPALLMINEVSPHLPVYCWGSVRDRLFSPEFAHFQKLATAHAPSLEVFCSDVNSWSGASPDSSTGPFDIAVFLSSDARGFSPFKVSGFHTFER